MLDQVQLILSDRSSCLIIIRYHGLAIINIIFIVVIIGLPNCMSLLQLYSKVYISVDLHYNPLPF